MSFDFKLPDLGEGIAEVELRRWLVKEGDRVAEHQVLAEVESDKAVVEVPSPHGGIVARIHRNEGETVAVGQTLVTIADAGENVQQRSPSFGIVGSLPEAEEVPRAASPAAGAVQATPLVRKLARERGIDLQSIRGSGPRGSITPEDLEQLATPQRPVADQPAGEVERLPLRGLRRTIARNVLAAQRATAFVTSMEEVDITTLWELRLREQHEVESRGTHLTFLPFFIKAAQHALREHPRLNAAIDDAAEEIVLKRHYHFGIAVDTEEGLMVPVIRDVDKKSILHLAAEIQELGRRARERTIAVDDLRGSSFTITNYGHFGGTFATPIINWPDVAILGCGRIVERPWVHQGAIAIRKILHLSLTFDHRVTDGVDAARFIGRVARYLEDPDLLFIESI
ncbi:dihydrolipoamide acetyltransferase family protein [Geobacter sp. SVR]|uniref:dihydrolipoamide acetyltransferase family protein n=1 Tax=Geobacter sp. SVR TaxID=2495594 RepID=UPI00143F00F5|nr:dihydrolipoamide acetyltransferase family protein [Geobacter sp. SVR]BCS52038.1 dihydrolipoamide acetyltransferase component of pyruvate dehydrogenase complex [Geobacter sp. SVR]GCF86493.1 dihydrolipoamide acetyltransferase component of pyruvate dehydrogenase complex [Geobacter sp. SVR]